MKLYVPCEGLVLAGGQSTRMQGQNKALLALNGAPLLSYALAQLAPYCQTTRIAAGKQKALYTPHFTQPIIEDSGTEGPLAGLLAGLAALDGKAWLICSPCDTPMAGSDWVEALLEAQSASPSVKAFYIAHQGEPHYAHSLWHQSVIPIVDNALASGKRSLKGCLKQVNAQAVALPKDYLGDFTNLNTPQALAELSKNRPFNSDHE